jgi:hypothetical protein
MITTLRSLGNVQKQKNTSFVSVLPLKQEAFKSGVSTMRMKDLGTKVLNNDSVK